MIPSPSLPTQLHSLFNLARGHCQTGQFAEAVVAYRQILAIEPNLAEACFELARVLARQGELDLAQTQYERAVALRPDFTPAHHGLAELFRVQDKFDEALLRYERVAALIPTSAEAQNNVANILAAMGRHDAAALRYVQALTLKPDFAEAHNNLGNVLKAQERLDAARVQYERALALKPDYVEAHSNLANVLKEQGRFNESVEHLRAALALKPNYAEAHNNLGAVLKDLGEFAESAVHYDRALALNPNYIDAHVGRAMMKTFRPDDPELAALEALAANPRIPQKKLMHIHFALGKALEDAGQYDRAFEQWLAGNALKRREVNHDEAGETQTFLRVREVIDSKLLESLATAGDPSPVPIFIVGMPRSGSTLIEQILASHPLVHGAGELPQLASIAHNVVDVRRQPIPYPEYLAQPHAEGLRQLGRAYLINAPALPAGKTRMTDKMPGNYRYIGLIRLILPNAKIIHVERDPVDTCLSCFSRIFTSGQTFSYDLSELGRAYRRYHELMAHWRSVLPAGGLLDVRYEDVVDNLEEQVRRMLKYCGLPWDERCLSFHKTDRPVVTASNVQVRQPLYRSSVERWRRYEAHLGPLLAELDGLTSVE
jgi:tetratricopeptide (TPR) repeat protein